MIDNHTTPAALHEIQDQLSWRPLRLLNYYRLFLATVFLFFFISGFTGKILGTQQPSLFFWVCLLYLVISVAFIYTAYTRSPDFKQQVGIQAAIDIITITVLMHASGGIESGIGMLLIVNVTASSVFLSKQTAYLTSSSASLAVLAEQFSADYFLLTEIINYPKAGILGLLLFSSAIIASSLSTRSRESQALAKQTTAELADLEKLNEHIIKNMHTGIVVVLPNGQIYMANEAAEVLLGNRKLDGRPHLSGISAPLYKRLRQWLKSPNMEQLPLQQQQGLVDLQPGMSMLDVNRKNSEIIIFLEDAAQLNQRFQEVKLASLGRLTASIAHEIRNPLGAINHAAQLLSESLKEPSNIKLSSIITTQVQRLNHTIENILQLSRQNSSNRESINLYDWLAAFKSEFCSSQGLTDEQLSIEITPRDTEILFDTSHLHQVIWNLCSNAVSHSQRQKPQIGIQLQGGVTLDSRYPFLDIIDNGKGIEPELVHQIFDPFFTTSSAGTGLGLYITKEMVESNRAKIRYIPLPSGGSCFRINFIASHKINNAENESTEEDSHQSGNQRLI
ncbi:MAG: ATP-binding protein [Gammaproteobacteria bacterium]|nr:ATP-binding protein [Gammaproteobacteria bacterium]